MPDMLELFWAAIAEQLQELRTAKTADDVLRTLATDHGPDRGFFAGSGGDETVSHALHTAGWELVWAESSLYYTMRAPDGSMITYIEGDIHRGDRHGNNPVQTRQPAH
ncbi:hypothetical protein ACFW9F_15000 [Streptomyces sp. NPDC059506]|uniref:hypothetical protein n=1 Tax=Streptomyces sp. NPDC059506 TaxID=3347751 RepID=UPI0036CA2102